jgi:hypothetical protein
VAETLPERLLHLLDASTVGNEVETTSGSELGADGAPTPTVNSPTRRTASSSDRTC